jgi:DNA-binding transcriptional LysR family regulator
MRPSYTSQPGISKSIIELEDELGVEIFTRHGKRLSAITDQGKLVVAAAERMLREVEALKRLGADYMDDDQGELIIAATHTYARDLLPNAIARFRALSKGRSFDPARLGQPGARDAPQRRSRRRAYASRTAVPDVFAGTR